MDEEIDKEIDEIKCELAKRTAVDIVEKVAREIFQLFEGTDIIGESVEWDKYRSDPDYEHSRCHRAAVRATLIMIEDFLDKNCDDVF